jgi:hypothetical protein
MKRRRHQRKRLRGGMERKGRWRMKVREEFTYRFSVLMAFASFSTAVTKK